MKTNQNALEEIHESLINGQRRQCVEMIDEYGLYDFWEDYRRFLFGFALTDKDRYTYFADMTISYHRIKSR